MSRCFSHDYLSIKNVSASFQNYSTKQQAFQRLTIWPMSMNCGIKPKE